MGPKRCLVFKCAAAVAFLSCLILFCPYLDAFNNYWSFLLSLIQIRQRETKVAKTNLNFKPYERKYELQYDVTFNVTELVLRELRGGFIAAVTEQCDRDYSPDYSWLNTVCVSEPTLLECGNTGFAALLLATLDHVSYCHILGIYNITFQWKNCQTSCVKVPGRNSWPAYFEPLNSGLEFRARKVICLGGIIGGRVLARETARTVKHLNQQQINQFNWLSRTSSLLELGFRKRQSLPGYEEGAIITPKLRKWVHGMISEYARPQKSIQLRVDQFFTNNMQGFNVLGVHVRGTDHWMETEEKALPTVQQWIQDAEALFDTLEEPKRIFLASDNDESVERFVDHFGDKKVVFTAAKRAKKYHSLNPVHSLVTNDAIEIGSQVLIDILLLAKCGHFLHAESSVASLASFFNPEMKLFFLGHLEDDTVNDDSNEKPLPDPSDEITEVEWENDWDEELMSLTRCYKANSPYSACPNMARGQLIDSNDVREIFSTKNKDNN